MSYRELFEQVYKPYTYVGNCKDAVDSNNTEEVT